MKKNNAQTKDERAKLLQSYISRLSEGEDLESVRKDFVENFHSVDAAEIAHAEQQLIAEGAKVSDVQRLCDVHSALFRGATREEQIAKAEAAVMESIKEKGREAVEKGHPMQVFKAENVHIEGLVKEAQKALSEDIERSSEDLLKQVEALSAVSIHYARKGDLIYPLLNRKYGFTGPASVMWGVDDEIRDELNKLGKTNPADPSFRTRLTQVVGRIDEMIYKENNILLPLCLKNFSEEDWIRIYYDMPAYDTLLSDGYPIWDKAEASRAELSTVGGHLAKDVDRKKDLSEAESGRINLGSGHMTAHEIYGVLNTIPMELTFVDKDNTNRFFSNDCSLFKRPDMAIGRDVFSCHPPKIEARVRQVIQLLREGVQDSVDVWMEKNGRPVLVRYIAVRDDQGEYQGALETVQDMEFARKYFEGKKDA